MRNSKFLITIIYLTYNVCCFSQQPFTGGNIVVYRVGNGSAALTTAAAAVYLDEYTADGSLVQSIAMPTAISGTNNILTARGLGGGRFEGMMNLSVDGKYLVVPGINTAPGGTGSTAAVIGLVDFNGKVNTTTAVTDFVENANIPLSAISDDGNRLWFSGFGAIRYATVGGTTSVLVNNSSSTQYDLTIADGQLYTSSTIAPWSVYKIGNGLPVTAGQSLSVLPGLPTTLSPIQFEFADLDPNVTGVDVLYIADQGATGGIMKFSLVGGAWGSNGNVGSTADSYTNLALKVSNNVVTIFATRKGANSNGVRGGELIKLIDNSGYNGTLTGVPTVIASIATANTVAFRGVALVPQPAPFTAGNIIVYRVGNGSAALTTAAAAVYLDEYTADGSLVQSIAMPTAISGTNNILTARGLGGGRFEGMMNLSVDGKYLVVPGINTAPGGTGSTAAVIGLVDFNGKVNTTTAVTDFVENANIPLSAISDDGNRLWFSGFGAIRYATVGGTTSVLVNNSSSTQYDLTIADGQLYTSSTIAPWSVYKIGNGLPVTAGQSLSVLPGLPTTLSPIQFEFADLDPNVTGVDVLYIADQGATGGIMKFSLVGGAWGSNGNVGSTADSYTNLALKVSNNVVTIFATRKGANSNGVRGGELIKLIDNSGYNGTLTGVPTVIASVATANTVAFRGVSKTPSGCNAVLNLQVPDISASQANISWKAPVSGGNNYEYAVTTTGTPPISGTATSNTFVNATGLLNGTTYYAHVRTICSKLNFSEWTTVSFVTGCKPPAAPLVVISISSAGIVEIKWNKVFGAASYEYFISTSSVPPSSGTAITDTSLNTATLNGVTQYYVHVRSNCGSGSFSSWTTKAFSTGCFTPTPNMTVLSKNWGVSWNKVNNAVRYEYALTYNAAKPLSGSITTDTFYFINKASEATSYYFHVRSVCTNGTVSGWSTAKFDTEGLQAYPSPVRETLQIRVNGITNPTGEIMVADAMGRVIIRLRLNGASTTIDVRGWAAGVYHIRYRDDQHQYTMRILKQ